MPTIPNNPAGALVLAALAVAGVAAVAVALNVIVRDVQPVPRVGDIVAFTASPAAASDDGPRLLVHRQDRFGCVLDLNTMRRGGGSLVVETAARSGNFRAHWAGARTSDDAANCGTEAELIVDTLDLAVLAVSAGGYGVDQSRMPVFPYAVSN